MSQPLRNYPLEVPAKGRPYWRAAERLGWHPGAAALATMGYLTSPQVTVLDQSASGGTRTAVFVAPRPGLPGQSIKAAEKLVSGGIAGHRNSLAGTDPRNPFLAALAAVLNLAELMRWNDSGGPVPRAFRDTSPGGCPFLMLLPDERARKNAQAMPWLGKTGPRAGIVKATTAAALVACGFIPFPDTIDGPSGEVAIGFARASATLPDFTVDDAMRAVAEVAAQDARAGGVRAAIVLTGFPPDEHPFLYALRAAHNVAVLQRLSVKAGADPLRHFVNKFNRQRTALITDHLLGSRGDARMLRELDKHLKKSAA